jgi:glycosyltransferase involved in cell wall biosynthesis
VLLGPVEIAGYHGALRTGLRELGVHATLYTADPHPFGYPGDPEAERVPVVRWTQALRRRYAAAAARGSQVRKLWMLLVVALQPLVLAWAVLRFDAFVFSFGSSITLFPRLEFGLLRLLRRRIVCVFHGSDTRPPYLDGFLMRRETGLGVPECAALAVKNKARAALADRFADCIVENPASAHFHERPCVNGLLLGLPVPLREAAPAAKAGGPVRVLHSPSSPESKGTAHIVAAVDRLRERGLDVELVLVTGKPHAVVLEELARCDFVVDQIYSDTPMAGFAAEAASFGRPAVVAGYAEEVFARWVPAEARAPTVYVRPEEVEAAIERLVVDAGLRRELGARARAFVRERCTPRAVAARYLRMLEGTVPAEWMFDPREIRYLHGCGIPESRARELVGAVVALAGPGGLLLSDKPELERRMLAFAREAPAAAEGVQAREPRAAALAAGEG